MPSRRCCCGGGICNISGCIEAGQAYCASAEAAESYIIYLDIDSALLGVGDTLCCDDMWQARLETPPAVFLFPVSTYSCIYEDEVEDACGRLYLEVISATSIKVTLELASGQTIVWKNTTTADPLCPTVVRYSAEDSDPPDDCAWRSRLCVYPRGSCCPDFIYPKTLHVTLVDTGNCDCDVTAVTNTVSLIEFAPRPDLVPVPPLLNGIVLANPFKLKARYRGTLTVGDCGLSGLIELWCYDDFDFADGIGDMVWMFNWEVMGGAPCLEGVVIGASAPMNAPDITCDPFILTFSAITDLAGCCPNGGSNLTVIFSE